MPTDSYDPNDNALVYALAQATTPAQKLTILREASGLRFTTAQELWQDFLTAQDTRKSTGSYYTGLEIADQIAARMLEACAAPPVRILEPACGSGNLLVALINAATHKWNLPAVDIARRIDAYDIDGTALRLAQWQLTERYGQDVADAVHWHASNALALTTSASDPVPTYDLIFANPPFGNAIDRRTARAQAHKALYKKHFPIASVGAFDKCAVFIELALQHAAPNAITTLILPQSWLAQPASSALRRHLAKKISVLDIHVLPQESFFNAAISTIAITWKNAPPPPSHTLHTRNERGATWIPQRNPLWSHGHWGAATHFFAADVIAMQAHLCPITDIAAFAAGASTEEAYVWKPHLRDAAEPASRTNPDERPLVIAGAIEPFALLWGEQKTRYLGHDYEKPMIALSVLSANRQQMSQKARVLLPTLSVALEAWPDLEGKTVGAVSTIAGWIHDGATDNAIPRNILQKTRLLCAIVNSAWSRLHYACLFSALALSGGNTQVSKNKLNELQIPRAWIALFDYIPEQPSPQMALEAYLATRELPAQYKGVPTSEAWEAFVAEAKKLAERFDKTHIRHHLHHLLENDPQHALSAGILDVLLLSQVDALVVSLARSSISPT